MQVLKSIKDLFKHKDSLGLHFGHKWLTHFECVNALLGFYHPWNFIPRRGTYQWSSSFGKHPSCYGHLVMCHLSTFLSHLDNISSFLFLLASFDKIFMQVCGDIMGPRSWESIQGPLMRCQAWLPISFGGIGLLSMEVCSPSTFLGSWILVVLYSCSKFCIFNRPISKEYVF